MTGFKAQLLSFLKQSRETIAPNKTSCINIPLYKCLRDTIELEQYPRCYF